MGKKGGKRNRPSGNRSFSSLSQHHLDGKTLQTPFRRLPNVKLTSWQDDHLPSMLWAALLTQALSRDDYLDCFRRIARHCAPWFEDDGQLHHRADVRDPGEMNFTAILDFDSLAQIDDALFRSFLEILLSHPLGSAALRPLLLLQSPPGINRWKDMLTAEATEQDYEQLARAVALCLDHQSEQSTDIRWLKVAIPILAGRLRFGPDMGERAREMLEFPNRGDLRAVRPSIRATEVSTRRQPTPLWVKEFWAECVRSTPCIDPTDLQSELRRAPSQLDPRNVFGTRQALVNRFLDVKSSERVDARLDATFGLALYSLSTITTLAATRSQETMLGRSRFGQWWRLGSP
jgi:hypothetical protein